MELNIKKIIEEQFGCEVNIIEIEPIFTESKFTGLSVKIEPKSDTKYIENHITITKTDVIFNM
jgi:hypothetical protein